jgi:hypothetical protein
MLIILCFICIFSCHPEQFCFSVSLVKGFYVVEKCRRIENFSGVNGRLIMGPTDFSFQFRMPEFSIVTTGEPKGLVLATQQQKESFCMKSIQACGPPSWCWVVLSPTTK